VIGDWFRVGYGRWVEVGGWRGIVGMTHVLRVTEIDGLMMGTKRHRLL